MAALLGNNLLSQQLIQSFEREDSKEKGIDPFINTPHDPDTSHQAPAPNADAQRN